MAEIEHNRSVLKASLTGNSIPDSLSVASLDKDKRDKAGRDQYILFQNGRQFSVLLFSCKSALVASSFKGKYSFEFQVQKGRNKGYYKFEGKQRTL